MLITPEANFQYYSLQPHIVEAVDVMRAVYESTNIENEERIIVEASVDAVIIGFLVSL